MKKILLASCLLVAVHFIYAQEAPEGLFISSKAPDFKGKDQDGKEIRLKDLLKEGIVVLVFYRGQWCPYCNRELSKLQDSLQMIKDKGAILIAVTPEKAENISKKNTESYCKNIKLSLMKNFCFRYKLSNISFATQL